MRDRQPDETRDRIASKLSIKRPFRIAWQDHVAAATSLNVDSAICPRLEIHLALTLSDSCDEKF